MALGNITYTHILFQHTLSTHHLAVHPLSMHSQHTLSTHLFSNIPLYIPTQSFVLSFFHFLLIGQMAPPLAAFGAAKAAVLPILEIIQRKPLIDGFSEEGEKPKTKTVGHIHLDNVTFAYPSRPDIQVCKGYQLKIEAGQTVAFCGASGAGKSTVINLLLRFYDPQVLHSNSPRPVKSPSQITPRPVKFLIQISLYYSFLCFYFLPKISHLRAEESRWTAKTFVP